MRFNPVCPLVRHEVGDWLSVAADDDGFTVFFQFGQQAGEVGFRFVNIHSFHIADSLVQLVHRVNGIVGFAKLAVGYLLDELRNDITRETPA